MTANKTRAPAAVVFAVLVLSAAAARAGDAAPDAESSAPFGVSPVEDEAVYAHAILNQFEGRFGRDDSFRWSGEAWVGTDTNRLWFKSEGEATNGSVEDGQQELFYSRPVTTFFDLQGGVRYDLDSRPGRAWAALGVHGLAPYFLEVSATAYARDSGHYASKLEGSYDLLLTQRWILQPQLEMNLYSKNDPGRGIGSGLSDLDAGIRLRYEFSRKFAPYIGATYEEQFGDTADFTRRESGTTSALRFTFGIRMWL